MTTTQTGTKVKLDNDILVEVSLLPEKDQVRGAAIFQPKQIDRFTRTNMKMSEGIQLWKGNEAYLMFLVERAFTLLSEMPADEQWLRVLRRNPEAYNVVLDELDDEGYVRALYIRHQGLTNDELVTRVMNVAMGIEEEKAPAREKKKPGPVPRHRKVVPTIEEDEDEEDDEE